MLLLPVELVHLFQIYISKWHISYYSFNAFNAKMFCRRAFITLLTYYDKACATLSKLLDSQSAKNMKFYEFIAYSIYYRHMNDKL